MLAYRRYLGEPARPEGWPDPRLAWQRQNIAHAPKEKSDRRQAVTTCAGFADFSKITQFIANQLGDENLKWCHDSPAYLSQRTRLSRIARNLQQKL